MADRTYLCIDLKSFYASVEYIEGGLDPMTTNIVVCFTPRKGDLGTPNYAYPCSGKFYWNFEPIYAQERYAVDIRSSVLVNACKESSIGERSMASNPYKDKSTL